MSGNDVAARPRRQDVQTREFFAFGDSFIWGDTGPTDIELSFIDRYAAVINATDINYAANGNVTTYDETSSTGDGGWATVVRRITAGRTAGPYVNVAPETIIGFGRNDIILHGAGGTQMVKYKHALRSIISRLRMGFLRESSDTTNIRYRNAADTGIGGWLMLTSDGASSGGSFHYTATPGDFAETTLPADYPGTPITVRFLGGGGGQGAVWTIRVDGVSVGTIDTRGINNSTRINGAVFRIPGQTPGARVIRATADTITSFAYIDSFEFDAEVPPTVRVMIPPYPQNYTATYNGTTALADQAAFTAVRAATREVVAEFTDGRVVGFDPDPFIPKESKYHHTDGFHLSDLGMARVTESLLVSKGYTATEARNAVGSSTRLPDVRFTQDRKPAVLAATVPGGNIANLSSPGFTVLDGITLPYGAQILVKNQDTSSQNGIYDYWGSALPLTRSREADRNVKVNDGMEVAVRRGTVNGGTTWKLVSAAGSVNLGGTAIYFRQVDRPVNHDAFQGYWLPQDGAARAGILESVPRITALANIAAMTTQRVSAFGGIVIPAGTTVNSITFLSGTTAAGTPLNQWFTLIRARDRVYLRTTTNGTTGAWGANSPKTLALSSPYTAIEDTPVYVGIMVQATTVPSLLGVNVAAGMAGVAPVLAGQMSNTLQTTPPADFASAGTISNATHGTIYPYFRLA